MLKKNYHNFDESFSYCQIFSYLLYRKVIKNSKNHVNQMKDVYQIDQNGQNEPKLTKVARTQ